MKISIDFAYDTVENLTRVVCMPNISKEKFIDRIYDDLWGNYLFSFFENRSDEFSFLSEDLILEKIESVISNEHIELLWNLYLENKDNIDSAVQERINLEEWRKNTKSRYERELERKRDRYSSVDYTPPKNAIPITYKGKSYKSKAQCCFLENISSTTLYKYLNNYEKV